MLEYFHNIGFPCPQLENPLMYYLCLSTVDRRWVTDRSSVMRRLRPSHSSRCNCDENSKILKLFHLNFYCFVTCFEVSVCGICRQNESRLNSVELFVDEIKKNSFTLAKKGVQSQAAIARRSESNRVWMWEFFVYPIVPSRSISCTLYWTTHHLMTTENRDWFINMVKRETTSSVSEENVSSSHSLPMVLLWCALCVFFPFLIPHSFHNYTECVSPLLPNRVHGALLLPTCMRANRELFSLCPFFFSATRWRKGPTEPTTVEHSRVQKLFPFTSKRIEKKFFRTRIVMLYRDGCRRHTAALTRIFPSLSDTWIITNTGKNTSNFIYYYSFFLVVVRRSNRFYMFSLHSTSLSPRSVGVLCLSSVSVLRSVSSNYSLLFFILICAAAAVSSALSLSAHRLVLAVACCPFRWIFSDISSLLLHLIFVISFHQQRHTTPRTYPPSPRKRTRMNTVWRRRTFRITFLHHGLRAESKAKQVRSLNTQPAKKNGEIYSEKRKE